MPASATMDKPIVNPATLEIDPMNIIVDSVPNVITQAVGMLRMETTRMETTRMETTMTESMAA
jgi:hypothetical protein